jgi:dTDP-glucose pyrophosphorylase
LSPLATKAVILARGLGTRLRDASTASDLSPDQQAVANLGIKALMPVGKGRVLLDLILENLTNAGFSEIRLVIGPEHDAIRAHCANMGIEVEFAIQHTPLGTADAVLAADGFIKQGELFAVVNSDNLYPVECLEMLRNSGKQGLLAFDRAALIANSNIPEERIAKFATIEIDPDGSLRKITEKPAVVDENSYVSMNAWLFGTAIFDACRSVRPSERGELELTAAVQYAIDVLAERFAAIPVRSGVLDLSSRADVAGLLLALGDV